MMTKSMEFFRAIYKKEIVFFIYKEVLDDALVEKILSYKGLSKRIGLDMKNVRAIDSKLFFECVLKNKFKLFNLNSEILAYLSLILNGGSLRSYISYEDFRLDKRELFRRNLKFI